MAERTTNYMLSEAYSYSHGPFDHKTLPAGSFVKPIDWRWVPKHVLEDNPVFQWVDKQAYAACHTQHGMVPIPWKILRAT